VGHILLTAGAPLRNIHTLVTLGTGSARDRLVLVTGDTQLICLLVVTAVTQELLAVVGATGGTQELSATLTPVTAGATDILVSKQHLADSTAVVRHSIILYSFFRGAYHTGRTAIQFFWGIDWQPEL
jgi:hypothetical protein